MLLRKDFTQRHNRKQHILPLQLCIYSTPSSTTYLRSDILMSSTALRSTKGGAWRVPYTVWKNK